MYIMSVDYIVNTFLINNISFLFIFKIQGVREEHGDSLKDDRAGFP